MNRRESESFFTNLLHTHEQEDERRFDKLGLELAKIKGMLTVLITIVVGSGILNYMAVH